MSVVPEPSKQIPGLDLLRAIAIVWVMLFHAQIMGFGTPWRDGTRFGWMGVDLFFALSGYLIGRQWLAGLRAGTASFAAFYRRRTFRILPSYLVIVLGYFALPSWREQPGIAPLWQFLTFTENLFVDLSTPRSFTHVWSLCVEEHFYLTFPLAAGLLFRKRSSRWTVASLIGVLLFGLLWRARAWFGFIQGAENEGRRFFEYLYYPTLTRLDGLLAGVTLAVIELFRPDLWAHGQRHARWLFVAGAGLFAGSLFLFDGERTTASSVFGFPLVAAAIGLFVAAAASPEAWTQRVRLPGVATLAALSYTLYLSHKLAFSAAASLGHDGFVALSLSALVAGSVLHVAVERPFLKLRSPVGARLG